MTVQTCYFCGEPAKHSHEGKEVTPTDRGNEIREASEWLCDKHYLAVCVLGWNVVRNRTGFRVKGRIKI